MTRHYGKNKAQRTLQAIMRHSTYESYDDYVDRREYEHLTSIDYGTDDNSEFTFGPYDDSQLDDLSWLNASIYTSESDWSNWNYIPSSLDWIYR